MGRPRVNDQDKRTKQVNIRLTKDEEDLINQHAAACVLSPANWIRKKVFTGKFPPVKMSALDASIYQELKKIGVNLNQVTRKINQGVVPNHYFSQQAELQLILNKILKTLIE